MFPILILKGWGEIPIVFKEKWKELQTWNNWFSSWSTAFPWAAFML